MRLVHRIRNLEATLPKPRGRCQGCGDIDVVKGYGLMHGGLLLLNWDAPRGRDLVWCKLCCRRFTCSAGSFQGGSYWVNEVLFDDRYDPLTPRIDTDDAL